MLLHTFPAVTDDPGHAMAEVSGLTGVLASFLVLLAITGVLEIGVAVIGRLRGRPFPEPRILLKSFLITSTMTVVITVAISLTFRWTGFTRAQFYRPSDRNFRQHEELALQAQDVDFVSADGTRLFGWFIPADGDAIGTVVHLHGSDRNVSFTVGNSHWLSAYGFNVFAFDYRGYGRSEGEPSAAGVLEDAIAALDYVRARPDVDPERLFLWGQSLGGQVALVAAHLGGTDGIRAIVSEATYASHRHHIKDKMAQMGPLWLVQWAVWLVTSDRYAAEGVVAELSPTPVLIVHGSADRGVLPYHADRLFAAAADPKEIWRVEGAAHLDIFTDLGARERLVEYFRSSLP